MTNRNRREPNVCMAGEPSGQPSDGVAWSRVASEKFYCREHRIALK